MNLDVEVEVPASALVGAPLDADGSTPNIEGRAWKFRKGRGLTGVEKRKPPIWQEYERLSELTWPNKQLVWLPFFGTLYAWK